MFCLPAWTLTLSLKVHQSMQCSGGIQIPYCYPTLHSDLSLPHLGFLTPPSDPLIELVYLICAIVLCIWSYLISIQCFSCVHALLFQLLTKELEIITVNNSLHFALLLLRLLPNLFESGKKPFIPY